MTAAFHAFGISAVISSCTLFYGSMLVVVGNALRRLARNRRIAAFASKAAGVFLIGFGIKLTTN